jgi:hypothetical protein
VHAVVADSPGVSLLNVFRACTSFPQSVQERLPNEPSWAVWLLGIVLGHLATRQTISGWDLRRAMLVHGCQTPMNYVKSLHEFDNDSILGHVNVPVLITRAQKYEIGDQAELVYHKLVNCEMKTFMLFRGEDDTSGQCGKGAKMLFSERVFAWLDETLSGR